MARSRIRRARQRAQRHRRVHIIVALVSLFTLTTTTIFGGGLAAAAAVLSDMPKLKDPHKITNWQTTKVFAADGTLLTNLYYEQDRILVKLSDVSPDLQNAVIAIEDARFYQHKGYDPQAIVRAFVTNLVEGEVVEGASTITQQYVKNTLITREKSFDRKLKEAFLAYQLEQKLSKKEILERYLNTIYFGQSWYGVETASLNYFDKRAKDLTVPEAALLAAIIKSPHSFSPHTHPDKAKERRDLVIKSMRKHGYITADQEKKALETPMAVKPLTKPTSIAPYFVEYVKQELIKKYGENVVFKGGLRVYTTLSLKMQRDAENAAWNTLDRPGDPSASVVAIEPKTGYIRAMVGGKDFEVSKYNLALSTNRQPGSSFKTFVFIAAIENGISPYHTYPSAPVTIPIPGSEPWEVGNYVEGSGGPPLTIREALVRSVNVVYAHLIMDVGAPKVVELANKMGIKRKINPNPAIALGGFSHGPSPLEMATAYATLANGGKYNEPTAIVRIEDATHKLIEERKPKPEQVISEATAYIATETLEDVIRRGTGTRARIGRPAAGKTGTASEYRDAWFCGFTPDLAAAVWVGHPEGQVSMYNVHGIRVAGGSFPAQIWGKFMSGALKDVPRTDFEKPKGGIIELDVCRETGLRANRYCPTVQKPFVRGKAPTKLCPEHLTPQIVEIPNVVGLQDYRAIERLRDSHFKYRIRYSRSSKAPDGTVIAQTPSGGNKARQGTTIHLIVSGYPEPKQPEGEPSSSPSTTAPGQQTLQPRQSQDQDRDDND